MFRERTVSELRDRLREWRKAGERIALVPTMGNLHAGHMALVTRARELARRVVVTIFVNPTQFGPGEDYSSYPRTLDRDAAMLERAGADLLFIPAVEEIYPSGLSDGTVVEVPVVSDGLCGAARPRHFRGVATVVAKLFNCVQPDVALFGEKDYQQLLVIRKMVRDLLVPLEIVAVPTVREPDGLALSSRNAYLTPEQRERAPLLYRTLVEGRERIRAGERDYAELESWARRELEGAGFQPDYWEVRAAADLGVPGEGERRLAILGAACLGRARLIDNILFDL
ncbi:MAG TPA: pantoate--beta-alanine ligase [Gammaproteobacteria bacterium]|nr:pantoate--beta-alanine ligase [Gammaproteobacteria bacterium]